MSSPAAMVSTLASLLGLDEPTAKEQILPYMTTMRSPVEVQHYLETLLPPGPAAANFTRNYLLLRFPPPPPPPMPKVATDAWGNPVRVPKVASSSSGSNARAQVSEQDRKAIEREFGNSGKVYVKNREDDGGWGGGGGGKKNRSASGKNSPIPSSFTPPTAVSRPTTPQLPPSVPELTRKPVPTTSKARKGEDPAAAVVDLSEAASVEMLEVDRALRSFVKGKTTAKGCLCQARLHPLSPFVPLCPSCALIVCSLNAPISPCPSCTHSPLLPSSTIATHVATLQSKRTAIIERETRRVEREREEEERERKAIRFPGLGDPGARQPGQGAGGRRGYADLVGGGAGGIEEKIERGYREGVTSGGRSFGGQAAQTASQAPGKVIRLNMKTHKVKIQRKTVVKKEAGAAKVVVEEVGEDEDDVEEDNGAWIDPQDDGLRSRTSSSISSTADKDPSRPFLNLTLAEPDRPLWVEEIILEPVSIDQAAVDGEEVEAPRAVVFGAGAIGEQKKKARSRGKKGAKGDEKAEGSVAAAVDGA